MSTGSVPTASALLLCLVATTAAAAPSVVVEVTGLKARPAAAVSPSRSAARAEAEAVMAQRCALCHGKSGRSDGVMSATLKPRPRDFSDDGWQRTTSDSTIEKAILEGGAAVGKSAIMPANPDLKSKPEVLAELVAVLRGFAKRGVVRVSVVGEGDVEQGSASAAPDDSGAKASVTVSAKPGTVTVRGWFDADEDGQRDDGEPTFEQAGVVVTDQPVTVKLSSSARRP